MPRSPEHTQQRGGRERTPILAHPRERIAHPTNFLELLRAGNVLATMNTVIRRVIQWAHYEVRESCVLDCRDLGRADHCAAVLHLRPDRPQGSPPITHPAFFYGFVGLALAWQFAFLFIATDPARYRPLMLPSMFEKFSYGIAVAVLVLQGRTRSADLVFAATDLLLGVLFVLAYLKTPRHAFTPGAKEG